MWQPFTEKARKAIANAGTFAQGHSSAGVTTGDILLGLLSQGDSIAAQVLAQYGVTIEMVLPLYEKVALLSLEVDFNDPPSEQITFAPKAKMLIEKSFEHARACAHNYIGTEHLLMAAADVEDTEVAEILHKELKIDLDDLVANLRAAVGKERPKEGETRPLPVMVKEEIFQINNVNCFYSNTVRMPKNTEVHHEGIKYTFELTGHVASPFVLFLPLGYSVNEEEASELCERICKAFKDKFPEPKYRIEFEIQKKTIWRSA